VHPPPCAQVLVGGGGWTTLLNLAGSYLYSICFNDWRPSWRPYTSSAPWWQAVAVAAVPTLVTRSILRARILRYLAWPFLMVAKITWVVVWFVLYPLRAVASLLWSSVGSTGFQVRRSGGGGAAPTPAVGGCAAVQLCGSNMFLGVVRGIVEGAVCGR
jgi:hypothetical protein